MSKSLAHELHKFSTDFLRGVLKPRPVYPEQMPGWWTRRVCWATGGWGRQAAFKGVQILERQAGCLMFDHWGASIGADGESVFATEPYPRADRESFGRGVAFIAETLGIHSRILTPWESWWNPGSTIRVEFFECDHQPMCERCKSWKTLRDESRQRKRHLRCPAKSFSARSNLENRF